VIEGRVALDPRTLGEGDIARIGTALAAVLTG
jgi:hypothetical protein